MPAYWKFGKVTIGIDWIGMKILILLPTIFFLFTPFIWIAIPILIYISYVIIHEFIHAVAVKQQRGIIDMIFLGYPREYINFQMPTEEAEKVVYGWGAFADLIIMLAISFSLFQGSELTKNNILFWLGILFIVAFAIDGLLPEHSDLQEYSERNK